MSAHQIFRLRNTVVLMALAVVFPVLSYAASAANVDFAMGNVTAVNTVGVQRPLTKGAEISNGDTIRTGDGGRVQVRFSDGAMVSLQPETDFRVDNYQFSGKADGEEKGFFSLLKGGLRTITGLVGRSNRDNYKVTTNVATIGIRGTEYTGVLIPGTGDLVVNTGEGLVEICNGAGCMLLASGQSGIVSSGGGSPRRTDSRPQLPPAQVTETTLPVFSSSENRSPDGSLGSIFVPMQSGGGYAVAYAGMVNSSAYNCSEESVTAS
ncbi:MAG: FecR domain-containing protein, partial [Betaproteobacteria bacterium]